MARLTATFPNVISRTLKPIWIFGFVNRTELIPGIYGTIILAGVDNDQDGITGRGLRGDSAHIFSKNDSKTTTNFQYHEQGGNGGLTYILKCQSM